MKNPIRCEWCLQDPLYLRYHDHEWGVPVHDDQTHFEFLVLESAQAGLSWLTILRRREHYRRLYESFDPAKVARFDNKKILSILRDKGIIRNRKKIESSVNNAKKFLAIQEEFGSFDRYIWLFTEGKPQNNHYKRIGDIPASTPLSETITKDLKKRGFQFIGATIVYAHMQATGLVNDHVTDCFRHQEIMRKNE